MSQTLMQVLYQLADNPECVEPLRREVKVVVGEEGWTKAGLDKMHKIDSFVRETQRVDVQGICSSIPLSFSQSLTSPKVGVFRLALRPFTFSNGMTVPAGTLVALPQRALHTDGDVHSGPDEFDGFRFSKMRGGREGMLAAAHQTVSTSSEHLAFGLGCHQW
jgi:cytochrome P450